MLARTAMIALNMYLIVGLALLLVIVVIAVIVTWTGVNFFIWDTQRRRAEAEDRKRRLHADGTPLPPKGRGLCTGCGQASNEVYFLPDDRHLCRRCYAQVDPSVGAARRRQRAKPER